MKPRSSTLQVQTLGFWALTICPLSQTSVDVLAPIPTWVLNITESHACQHFKIIIFPKIPTHQSKARIPKIWMARPQSSIHELLSPPYNSPTILLNPHGFPHFDHLIGDNWCWTSPRGFWNRQQDGRHLWDRLQHLLLVIAIETLKLTLVTKLNYFQSFLSQSGLYFLKSTYSLLNHYICHKSPRRYQERPQG